MTGDLFTGEFLVPGDSQFAVDLAQHLVPYLFCVERVAGARVVEIGCGAGYGAHYLAGSAREVHAYDRNLQAITWARSHYQRPNLIYRVEGVDSDPEPGGYTVACVFQVLEHVPLADRFLERIVTLLRERGTLYLTTPNRLTSAGENIYHVREYEPEELAWLLRRHFPTVELLGITGGEKFRAYLARRRRAMRRYLRCDPLRLRRVIPRRLLTGLYPVLARAVRRQTLGSAEGLSSGIEPSDFRVDADRIEACDDLLAICACAPPR